MYICKNNYLKPFPDIHFNLYYKNTLLKIGFDIEIE